MAAFTGLAHARSPYPAPRDTFAPCRWSTPAIGSSSLTPASLEPPTPADIGDRSEEHTSELQSRQYLVCRLLLEKKKQQTLKHSLRSRTTRKWSQPPASSPGRQLS